MSRFQPGASGNPKGRPRGIQTQAKLRAAISRDIPEIIQAMLGAAKSGDVQAARLLLDRTLPTLKATDAPAPLSLPTGTPDLAAAATATLGALTGGALTPDQAGAVAGVLSALARVRETTELEARVAALEDRAHGETA